MKTCPHINATVDLGTVGYQDIVVGGRAVVLGTALVAVVVPDTVVVEIVVLDMVACTDCKH